jgi:hypothetical protein
LKRQALFQILGLRRSGQAWQIVATSGKFVTPISGLAGCAQECVGRTQQENRRVESRFDQPAGVSFRVFWLLLTGKTLTGKALGLTKSYVRGCD